MARGSFVVLLLKAAVFEPQLHADCRRQPGGKPGREREAQRVTSQRKEREREGG